MGAVRVDSVSCDTPIFVIHPRGGRRLHATLKISYLYQPRLLDQVGVIPVGDVYCGFQSTTLCGINVGVGGIPGSFKPNSRRSPCRACVALAARRMEP